MRRDAGCGSALDSGDDMSGGAAEAGGRDAVLGSAPESDAPIPASFPGATAEGIPDAAPASRYDPSGLTRQPRFCVVNLGCKVNRVESDTISAALIACGGVPSDQDEADVVVVNTCTVTSEADSKTRKAIRNAARRTRGTVIATGCAAAMGADALAQLAPNVMVLPAHLEAERAAVGILAEAGRAGMTDGLQHGSQCGVHDAPGGSPALDVRSLLSSTSPDAVGLRSSEGFKTRMDIKIQDGCDNSCTFCIVCKARGPARSLPVDRALSQIAAAAGAGVREIIITGINVGSYRSGSVALAGLLQMALEQTDIGRIRISSIEPQSIDSKLVDVLVRNPGRLCAHFHIPLQSGCDRTLEAMGRLYDKTFFESRVEMIREARPDAAITTDLIVGFPGETESDFKDSLRFCQRMRFSRIHVFRFSPRPGTQAAEMPGRIDASTSAARSSEMRRLSQEMGRADMLARIGSEEFSLMISERVGVTESYHEVVLDAPQRKGDLVRVLLAGEADGGRLAGRVVPISAISPISE